MKQFVFGFLVGSMLFGMMAIAGTRDDLYRRFGPKMQEAIVKITMDEFNRNRAWHSQPLLTTNQMVTALQDALDSIPDYSWQDQ